MSTNIIDEVGNSILNLYTHGFVTKEYLDYWEATYATTQSEALKQKAALILGIKKEKK